MWSTSNATCSPACPSIISTLPGPDHDRARHHGEVDREHDRTRDRAERDPPDAARRDQPTALGGHELGRSRAARPYGRIRVAPGPRRPAGRPAWSAARRRAGAARYRLGRAGYRSTYSRYRRLIPARAATCALLRCSSARRRATRLLRSPGSGGDGQDSPRGVPLAPSSPSGLPGLLPGYVTHAHRDHGATDRAQAADAASPPRFSQLSCRAVAPHIASLSQRACPAASGLRHVRPGRWSIR